MSNAHGGEGNGTVSAFNVSFSGELTSIGTSPFADLQTAPCWVEISHDGQFLFTVNTGSGEISSYAIAPGGSLTLIGSTPFGSAGAGAVDARLSPDGRTLLVNGSKADVIASFAVNGGNLTELPELTHTAARRRRRLGHRRRLTRPHTAAGPGSIHRAGGTAVKHHEQPYPAGLYVGDGVGTVGASLHLDDLPVAHRDDHYLTAMMSTGRMSGSEASSSPATCVSALGISPLMCAWRASSVSKVSKMP